MSAGVTIKDHLERHCLDLAEKVWPRAPVNACPVVSLWDRQWYVVQSVMRGEEDLRKALLDIGFDCYLPKMKKDVQNPRFKTWSTREFLLFNRYAFAKLPCDTKQWGAIFAVKEFECALGSYGRPAPVREADIERFRKAEREMLFDDTEEAKIYRKEIGRTQRETTAMRFPHGSRAKARGGPFGGYSCMVVNVNGRGAVDAMVNILGRLTRVEFAAEALEPIG